MGSTTGGIAKPGSEDPAMPQVPWVKLAKSQDPSGIDFCECLPAAKTTGEIDLQFSQAPVSHQKMEITIGTDDMGVP